jgi:hypothetical protein
VLAPLTGGAGRSADAADESVTADQSTADASATVEVEAGVETATA